MSKYLLHRLALMVPVIWGVGTFVFFVMRMLPGDAVDSFLEDTNANPAAVQAFKEELGLDKPIHVQYVRWLGNAATLDFGQSMLSDRDVRDRLVEALPVSIELAVIAVAVTLLVAVPGGVLAAAKRDTPWDYGARLFAVLFLSVPNFWLATLALVLPAIWFGWIPPLRYHSFADDPVANLQQFLLPGLILGISSSAVVLRMMRSQMIDVLLHDYIRTARAKGLRGGAVVFRHATPNALIPVSALVGNEFARILGGTVILETIFGLPGIGRLTVDAIQRRDYPQVEVNVLFFALVFVFVNLAVDLFYGVIDPRVRHA